jgi:tRNA threonylcarbamoyladenosine biosynthesis protein TsaB
MLLAVDTSTSQTGLALFDGLHILAELAWTSKAHHTQELAPAVNDLLKRIDAKTADIQALGVAIGPGSFTSLRVGLAFVKGLALARRLPVIGISTLDVVAAPQPIIDQTPLAAVLHAGRGRLALGWYAAAENRWQAQGNPNVTTADALAESIKSPTIVCGELSAEERQRLARKHKNALIASPAANVRRPAILAELAWARWQAGQVDNTATLVPIYLHVAEPIPS